MARYTRTAKYARRLLYFTNYHIHDYGDFRPRNKILDESKQHTNRVFIDQRSGAMDREHQRNKPNKGHSEKT